jgi:methyltransferase family protein
MRRSAPPHEESRLVSWFDKKQGAAATGSAQSPSGPRAPRYSGSWAALRKRLQAEPGLRIIDVGYTSPNNINYLTDLGHSVFLSDLVHDACMEEWQTGSDEDGNPIWNVDGFLKQSLDFAGRLFDVVLLWTALDYLPEPFVAPVVAHLHSAMNPGGQVLALFHTRTHGEETIYCRYHVTATDNVEVQLAHPYPIQRAFTNRSIERLFAGWSGHKQFLAKDSVSEVIMTR